jgi:hypothetical protein
MAEVSSEHFRWDGFPWVRQRDLTLELRILAAIGLLLADALYVVVVILTLLLGAGDVGATDLLVKSLLVFGIAIAQAASAVILARLFGRVWWELSLLAAWPFWFLLVLLAANPNSEMWKSALLLVLAIVVIVGVGGLAAFGTAGQFRLTADGQWWWRPGEYHSALSPDGAWRWVGDGWREERDPVPPIILATEDWKALASNQEGRITRWQIVRRISAFGWGAISAPWRPVWADGRSLWWWLGCLPVLPVAVLVVVVLSLISTLAILMVVVAALIVVVDSRVGIETFEGELCGVADGRLRLRQPTIALRCPRRVRAQLVEGAPYRIYRTRATGYLANFEQINTQAIAGPTPRPPGLQRT